MANRKKNAKIQLSTIDQKELTAGQKRIIIFYNQFVVLDNELYFLKEGEEPVTIKLVLPTNKDELGAPNPDQPMADRYLSQLRDHLEEVFRQVEKNQEIKLEKTKLFYDRNIKPSSYKEGDHVLKNVVTIKPGLSKKLALKWEGPFLIIKKINEQKSKGLIPSGTS
ncbi:integrase core domain [Brachionus plicatilis]|uniref:Integrase core domain n=1 Tax=Brachionus plicatilis TaxID=10195 RepID=A0A3M7RUS3_BRAPC|nr:integrase core domain [Brachionus plicatilis]